MKKLTTNLLTVIISAVLTFAIALLVFTLGDTIRTNTATTTTTSNNVQSIRYFMSGRYYFTADLQGQVLTEDGNLWNYTTDTISDEPSYNNQPIIACLDDNGTPDDITDDIILGLVFDRTTAIYDDLEDTLSDSFELEREGNNIRIHGFTNIRQQQLEEVK